MTNDILTLIKIITALYFNSKSTEPASHLVEEAQRVMSTIEVEGRGNLVLGSEEGIIEALQYTAEWMLSVETLESGFDREAIITRLKVNLAGENDYLPIITESLIADVDATTARVKADTILTEIRHQEKKNDLRKAIAKANRDLNFESKHINPRDFVRGLMDKLEGLGVSGEGEHIGHVGRVDFTDPESVAEILQKGVENASIEGVLKTGLLALDKSTGIGGLPRGSLINFGGLTHHYKTGILSDLALNIPMFNDPHMWDPKKIPMVLRISFENTPEQDITFFYKKLHELKHGKKIDKADINVLEAAKEIAEHFGQRGYEFHMESFDPNNFDVYDLFDIIKKYENLGYEIHLISCDYLSLIAHNTIGDRMDYKIQKTFEMTRNFCFPKGITFATACQLSTQAQELAREGTATFTRKVNTGGWYMDCRSLHTKLDLEYVIHIHKHVDGDKYLMFGQGKNRSSSDVPEKHKHFMYKFQPIGGIVPDGDKEDDGSTYYHKLPSVIDAGEADMWAAAA